MRVSHLAVLGLISTIGVTTAAAAQAGQTACSIIDAAALKRLTGRQDLMGQGPRVAETSVQEPGRTGCSFLDLDFELVTQPKPGSFQSTRTFLEKGGATSKPVSGVGEQAFYWWSQKPGRDRPVGIVFKSKSNELLIMQMTSSDSIEILKPKLLEVAKALAPKLK
jgi:hypothetical protein